MRRPKGDTARKSVTRRFKTTATGKVLRRRAGDRHPLQGKVPNRRRSLRQATLVEPAEVYRAKQSPPFSR